MSIREKNRISYGHFWCLFYYSCPEPDAGTLPVAGHRRQPAGEETLAALDRLDDNLALFRQNTAAVSSITIYTNNPGIPDCSHITYVPEIAKEEWYNNLGDEWSTWTCLTTTDIVGNPYTELALVKKLAVVSQEYSAYLVLRLDNNYLKNRIEQSDNLVLISVDSLPVFYASDRRLLGSNLPFPADFNGSYCSYTGNTQLQGQKMLSHIATFTPYKTNNYFYICTNDSTAQESVNHMTLLYILIITLAVSVPTLVILLFSSFFSKRVGTLKAAMHRARLGDYNIIDEVKGDDELTETFEDLKATVLMDLLTGREFNISSPTALPIFCGSPIRGTIPLKVSPSTDRT